MDPGPTISRPYTRHKWVGRMICSQANVSAHAQDLLRLPESMTIIKNRTDNLRFSFPLMNMFSLVLLGIVATVLLFGNQAFAYGGYGGHGGYRVAFSNSYSYSSNNNYSLLHGVLLSSDKNTCFSSNDKLVDPNNNNWTHVFENAKDSVVKVTVSNPYNSPEISTGFIYDGHIVTNYHVVKSANPINVTFADGNSYPAQITGTDPYSESSCSTS